MNIKRGTEYEQYICKELNKTYEAWMWRHIPEKHLIDSDIVTDLNKFRLFKKNEKNDPESNPLRDTGIDILCFDKNTNTYTYVQCKNYTNNVRIEDLAGFSFTMMNHPEHIGAVYYTSGLSINIKENSCCSRIQYHKKIHQTEKITDNKIVKLRPYQIKAVRDLSENFKTKNRGILSMPCGTGKTLVACEFAKRYKHVIIISRIKQHAEQNMIRFAEHDNRYDSIKLIDSDGTRDIKELDDIIATNDKMLFSATYASVDIVNMFIDKLSDVIVIIDEFHNLTKTNLINESDDMFKLLHSKHNIMFMSATPRVYELEGSDYENETFEDIFGPVIVTMNFVDAIKNNYICDYKLFVPSISEDTSSIKKDIVKEIELETINDELTNKCMYLITCLKMHGTRKCIVYLKSHEEISEFISTFNKLNKFYCLDCWINSITSDDRHSKIHKKGSREWKLDKFTNNENVSILCSVQILDECIDIPECDAVFISYQSCAKIRTIQRISRCLRKTSNKNKIGHVYLWCQEYDKIIDTLSCLKEYDPEYKNKIFVEQRTLDYNKKFVNKQIIADKSKIDKYIVGVKEFQIKTWLEIFDKCVKFANVNKRLPSRSDSVGKSELFLAKWLCTQRFNIRKKYGIVFNNIEHKRKYIDFIKKYRPTSFDSSIDVWNKNFKLFQNYVAKQNKLPAKDSKSPNEKRLGMWLYHQKINYKNKDRLMKNNIVFASFCQYIANHKLLFMSKREQWFNNIKECDIYVNKFGKLPPKKTKIGSWFQEQCRNYKVKEYIMKQHEIRSEFEKFMKTHSELFKSNEELWNENLAKLVEYVEKHNKLPCQTSKDKEIKSLTYWVSRQKRLYKKHDGIMKNANIKKKFAEFIKKYPKLFKF